MKVSVLVTTYNHEKYIAQAINSILMQQVSFDYEVIVGEDCSADSTRDIVIDYRKRNPDKIRLILPKENLGSMGNKIFAQLSKTAKGQYVALLDGDDYWTSPHKLQNQVDFLDTRPECSGCFHGVIDFYEDDSREACISPSPDLRRNLFLEDILVTPTVHAGAIMYRNGLFEIPDWFYTSQVGDWEWFVFIAQQGTIGYIDEVMAVYRRHSGGCYHASSPFDKLNNRIQTLKNINVHLNFRYNRFLRRMISQCYHFLSVEYAISNDLSNARTCFIESILECPFNPSIPLKSLLKILLKLYFPPLSRFMEINPDFSQVDKKAGSQSIRI